MVAKQQYLLYDENCPLCNWYTRIFVRFNFIESESRVSYQNAAGNTDLLFDRERAKSEIALVSKGEEALYGIDSMLSVISTKWKVVAVLGRFLPVYWMLQLLYRFISFNRKVIAPTKCNNECSCTPKFNLFWRIVFIAFCGFMTYVLVGGFFNNALSNYIVNGKFRFEFLLFIGQLIFQSIVFKLLKQKGLSIYLGHLAFVSLLGAFALGISGLILELITILEIELGALAPFFLGVVVSLMIVEHFRRVKLLGFSSYLTLSLIVFRIIIYPLVFIV